MSDDSETRSSGTNRLSRAGKEALDEYLTRERSRVLSEASRLGRGAPLSAFDIVNAVEALSARDRANTRQSYPPGFAMFRSTRMLMLFSVALILMTFAVVLLLALPMSPMNSSAERILPVILGALTASLAVVGVTIAMVGVRRANSARRQQETTYLYTLNTASRTLDQIKLGMGTGGPLRRDDKSAGQYITKWISFERQLRDFGSREVGIAAEDARRYPIGELLRMLRAEAKMSTKRYDQVRSAMVLRNKILHDGEFSTDEVEQGIGALEDLSRSLDLRVTHGRGYSPDLL